MKIYAEDLLFDPLCVGPGLRELPTCRFEENRFAAGGIENLGLGVTLNRPFREIVGDGGRREEGPASLAELRSIPHGPGHTPDDTAGIGRSEGVLRERPRHPGDTRGSPMRRTDQGRSTLRRPEPDRRSDLERFREPRRQLTAHTALGPGSPVR